MEDIAINNVDPEMLEEQRLALSRLIDCATVGRRANKNDLHLLGGLQNMLDAWSDERSDTEAT